MSQIRNHDVCWCVLVRISSGSQTSLKPEDVITSCCWGQPPAKPNAGRAHNSSTYTMSQPTREEIHKMWWWPDAEGFHKVHPFTTAFTICFPHSKQKLEGPAETRGTSRNQRDQQTTQSAISTKPHENKLGASTAKPHQTCSIQATVGSLWFLLVN